MQVLCKARSITGNGIQFGALRATQGRIGEIQTGRHWCLMQLQRGERLGSQTTYAAPWV